MSAINKFTSKYRIYFTLYDDTIYNKILEEIRSKTLNGANNIKITTHTSAIFPEFRYIEITVSTSSTKDHIINNIKNTLEEYKKYVSGLRIDNIVIE